MEKLDEYIETMEEEERRIHYLPEVVGIGYMYRYIPCSMWADSEHMYTEYNS